MIKKLLGALGAAWVVITLGLAIFDPPLCIDWLVWQASRIQALGAAIQAQSQS
jgi:hypothetical protein